MRAEMLLTHRYIRQHLRQFLGVFICITLLATAIFSVLMLRDSFLETNRQLWDKNNGMYMATIYHADTKQVYQQLDNLRKNGSGITVVTDVVAAEGMNEEEIPYIGTMDENTRTMRGIVIEEGKFPTDEQEIAIERSTYNKLNLHAQIGDTIVLPVKTDHGVEEKSYVFVGYLSDYINHWILAEQGMFVAEGITDPIQIPGILTAENEPSHILNTMVSCSERYQEEISGRYIPNTYYQQSNPMQASEQLMIQLISAAFFIFLVIIIVLGICGIVNLTLRERKKYIGLLRCIGLTSNQTLRMLLLQGFYLSFACVAASFILGSLGVWIAGIVLQAVGQTFYLHITYLPFVVTFVVVAGSVFGVFLIQTLRLLKSTPLEWKDVSKKAVKQKRFSWKFSVLWGRATSKRYRLQNIMSITLITGCIFLLLVGSFTTVFLPRVSYSGYMNYYRGIDYMLGLMTSSSSPDSFHVPFPRNVGISKENINLLRNTDGLEVYFAGITHQSRQLIVIPGDTDSPFLLEQKNTRLLENEQNDFVLQQAGAKEGDVLAEAPVTGIDQEQLKKLEPYIVEGKIDYEQFAAGNEIIVDEDYYKKYGIYPESDYFQVGDEFTIVTPLLPEGSTRNHLNGQVNVKIYHVKVGAILSGEKRGYENTSIYPFDGKLLMCSDLLFEADPELRYDYVFAGIRDGINDPKTLETISQTIYRVAVQSKGISVTDLLELRKTFKTETQNLGIMMGMSVIIFLIIVTAAIFMMTNIKIKINLRSYILLRSVGLDSRGMKQIIFRENIKNTLKGILLGSVLGFGICVYWAIQAFFISTQDIFFYLMIPACCVVSVLLIMISILACLAPLKKVDRMSIIEKLHEVNY